MTELERLSFELRQFRDARGWKKYHTPKNLAMALCGECGELAALFQWLTDKELPARPAMSDELADVFIYLLQLADAVSVDLIVAAYAKMEKNERKYPAPSNRDL